MELYLVRHTAVEKKNGYCYGRFDLDLAASFSNELLEIRKKLPLDLAPFTVYASSLKRCHALAECLKPNQVIYDDRLLEYNYGDWEGCLWNDIDQIALTAWMEDFVSVRPPSGESFEDLQKRCQAFWSDLRASQSDQCIVVSHAGWIRALLCLVLGMPLQHAFRINLDYGSISRIDVAGEVVQVKYINR